MNKMQVNGKRNSSVNNLLQNIISLSFYTEESKSGLEWHECEFDNIIFCFGWTIYLRYLFHVFATNAISYGSLFLPWIFIYLLLSRNTDKIGRYKFAILIFLSQLPVYISQF